MARGFRGPFRRAGMRAATALAALMIAGTASCARVEVPGDALSVDHVDVTGMAAASAAGAASPVEAPVPRPRPMPPLERAGVPARTGVAPADLSADGPTLADARWVGFTPAVYTGEDTRPGAWISGPFDREERTGWITDTATGATTRVTFLWREGGRGSMPATLSTEAARALDLGQGDVANLAVYLPR